MKRTKLVFGLIALIMLSGCGQSEMVGIHTARDIKPLDLGRTTLNALPEYDPYSSELMQVDLRGYDLTRLEISSRYEDLIHADFDTTTKWPYWLPDGFDPKRILEGGKNPGLGIRWLHEEGITGKGVSVAIIDDVLLPGHVEYRQALKCYEEISCFDEPASVTGCRQASLLVGETTGVAPESELYYIAVPDGFDKLAAPLSPLSSADESFVYDPLVSAVHRIMELNDTLENEHKIRVLCIGYDVPRDYFGYYRLEEAIQRAKSNGIFVLTTSLYETYDYQMDFNGLGRDPLGDPDHLNAYKPGHIWEHDFYTFGRYVSTMEGLLVPMDVRTAAAPTGMKHYAYYAQNDSTLCIPTIGGLYALACQVDPSISPEIFWEKALQTGDIVTLERKGISFSLKKMVNPIRLMEAIKK